MPDREKPLDDPDGPRLSDLVSEREDLIGLRDRFKELAKRRRDAGDENFRVGDLIAQSTQNDPTYVQPADLEKAEWFAEIWEQERDTVDDGTHPRNMHYRMLGEYEMRNGETYDGSTSHWNELKDAIKWARILGLVDNEKFGDERNEREKATPNAFDDFETPAPQADFGDDVGADTLAASLLSGGMGGALGEIDRDADREADGRVSLHHVIDDGYRSPRFPSRPKLATLDFDDVEEFIRSAAKGLVEHAFEDIYFAANAEQRYYIEVWCEKSGEVPEDLAAEYGATLRPAGGGEFSLEMVQDAVRIAGARGQDLAVVIVSDYDAKGKDMPTSAARKLEVEGALAGVEVELVHGAVTKDQIEKYGIPGVPEAESTPANLEHGVNGAKGYETHKQMFRDYAGDYPVEISGFSTTYPEEFREELADVLEGYYDEDLGDRLKDAIREAQSDAYNELVDELMRYDVEIANRLEDLRAAINSYHDTLEYDVGAVEDGVSMLRAREKEVREREDIPEHRRELTRTIQQADTAEALANVDVEIPDPETPGSDNPLLDTRRSYIEQLKRYSESDIRHS